MKYFFGLMLLPCTFALASSAESGPRSLKNVYLLKSTVMGREYDRHFSYLADDDNLDMDLDPTCDSVQVKDNHDVICVSSQNEKTLVGQIDHIEMGTDTFRRVTIKWNHRVTIVRGRDRNGNITVAVAVTAELGKVE